MVTADPTPHRQQNCESKPHIETSSQYETRYTFHTCARLGNGVEFLRELRADVHLRGSVVFIFVEYGAANLLL
jgi:hypothetical protein